MENLTLFLDLKGKKRKKNELKGIYDQFLGESTIKI